MRGPLRAQTVGWGMVAAGVCVVVLVLVTWKASHPLLFLLYPLLLLGTLALLALGVLWGLRHI